MAFLKLEQRSNHRFGLSDGTKELMRKRDHTRGSISKASGQQKGVLLQQYKKLRNLVTSKIRKENIDYNNSKIDEANNVNHHVLIYNSCMT